MDDSVRQAMEKWPDVPDLFGWLELAATGRWLIKGEPILHQGLIDFIGRNYMRDDDGRWYFQNGPQRVYVDLEYTPWVLYVDNSGTLRTHTNHSAEPGRVAAIDDDGHLLIETERGIGVVASGALPAVTDWLYTAAGEPAGEDGLAAIAEGQSTAAVYLHVDGQALPVERIERARIPERFGFIRQPSAETMA